MMQIRISLQEDGESTEFIEVYPWRRDRTFDVEKDQAGELFDWLVAEIERLESLRVLLGAVGE